jgi:hypothetical protein
MPQSQELIQALGEPLPIAGLVLFLLSILTYLWAKLRMRSVQLGRLGLIVAAFSVVVSAMATYQAAIQAKADREYRSLHALYSINATVNGTIRSTSVSEPKTFTVSSGQANVGCNDTRSVNATWSLPPGAVEVQATAEWQSANNIRSQSQIVKFTPTVVVAEGIISGRERNFFGNCEGGGHGELVLKGTYRVTNIETRAQQVLKTLDNQINRGQPFIISIPRGDEMVAENCVIVIREGGKEGRVYISFNGGHNETISIRDKREEGNIPISITTENDRVVLRIL